MAERIVGRDAALAEVARAGAANETPNLRGANLRGANLRGADLRWADLRGANLLWANLSEADLSEADLREANLGVANLLWANLREADLSWANLRWANLSEADLSGANLSGASLGGASLSGASLPDGWAIRSWIGAGSERRMTTLAIHPDDKHTVWYGCLTGTVDDLAAAVELTHAGNPVHLEDYRAIVADMRRILARGAAS